MASKTRSASTPARVVIVLVLMMRAQSASRTDDLARECVARGGTWYQPPFVSGSTTWVVVNPPR